jgi:hypothetical protein
MSGGLLEKAQAKTDDTTVATVVDATVDSATPKKAGGGFHAYVRGSDNVRNAAGGLLLLGAVLIFLFSRIDFDFFGWVVLGILLLSAYLATLHLKINVNDGAALSGKQWGAILVVWILLSVPPWVAGWEDEVSSILLTEGTVDEDTNEVNLMLRQSAGGLFASDWEGGDVSVSVSQDGEETWSGSVNVQMDQEDMVGAYGTLTLKISDFFANNSIRLNGFTNAGTVNMTEHPYTVTVEVEGQSASALLPTLDLTRNLRVDGDVDEEAHGQVGDSGCESSYTSCVEYVEIRGWVGLGIESADDDTSPIRVRGDYSIDVSFGLEGEDSSVDLQTISVSGTDASWPQGSCSGGSMDIAVETSGFMLECDGQDRFDDSIALNDNEYGCYDLTMTVSQGDEVVAASTSYYIFEQHSDSAGSPPQTYYWETFESVESC